jgi:integrase/recombinase XerD
MERLAYAAIRESEQSWRGAVELFDLRCRSGNLSPATILWYGKVLGGFAAFLESLPDKPLPRNAKPLHVRAYLEDLRSRDTAPGSVKRFYVCLKTFFRFLEGEKVLTANPMAFVEKPRAPKVLIRPLSQEQVRVLLAQADTKTFVGLRNWVMMLLLVDSGLRLSELLGIRSQDVDWAGNGIRVMGKGAKERVVCFGSTVKKALWDYKQRRGATQGQDFFFVDQFGRPVKRRWLQQLLARYGRRAGVEGVRVSPHTLRHTFAVQYLLNGGDAFSLQKLLGHSSMETVKIYVELSNRDVSMQHQKFSPLDIMTKAGGLPGERRQVRLK